MLGTFGSTLYALYNKETTYVIGDAKLRRWQSTISILFLPWLEQQITSQADFFNRTTRMRSPGPRNLCACRIVTSKALSPGESIVTSGVYRLSKST